MANEITTTSANDLSYAAEIVASAILDAFYGHNNVRHLTRYESIAAFPSTAKNFPITPKLAASALTEGADMSNTAFTTSVATLTVGESGLMLTPTDLLSSADIVDINYYAAEAGKALANKLTTDVTALATGFSTSVGSTGVNLTEQNVLDAGTTLAAAGVPGPYHGVLHPQQWNDLAGAVGATINPAGTAGSMTPTGVTNVFGVGTAANGGLVELYGVIWSVTSNVPTANAGADRAGMVVAPMNGIGYVEKWPARVEMQRDASLRASEIVVTSAYAVGELRDAAGVGVVTDA